MTAAGVTSQRATPSAWVVRAATTACTACGLCVATCPTGALRPAPRRPEVLPRLCSGCGACLEVCPRDALETGAGGEAA